MGAEALGLAVAPVFCLRSSLMVFLSVNGADGD
jgi:hypothetical protein